jgi:PIN domain nuclease of toxin-antitoxin system
MNLLLDTHVLLWAAGSPQRLSPAARALLEEPDNTLWFSAASLWEITIKSGIGRADFRVDARLLRRGLLDNDWRELAISGSHALATGNLPPLHRDPFDRMLLAQAETEGILLLTADSVVAGYPCPVRLI